VYLPQYMSMIALTKYNEELARAKRLTASSSTQ
jgi:hypothetical protein